MVIRMKKRSRKYLGSRTWGWGNKKNNRGSGSRGGIGRAGKKHKFTRIVVYEKERVHKKGFKPFRRERLMEIDLNQIESNAEKAGEKPTIELEGYKVLGNGTITKAVIVKATGFSKNAEQKIKEAGGEAIKL
jgi:large subunit ribosomal protein L15